MLLVFSKHTTARVAYIMRFLLQDICGFTVLLTDNKETYQQHAGCTLNYSEQPLRENDVQILPSGFLKSGTLQDVSASMEWENERPKLKIEGHNIRKDVFDPFSAAFFLLSRYEEYGNAEKDEYGRYKATSSILYRYGLLERPIVDEWALELKEMLLNRYPELPHFPKKTTRLVTIDVDQAFAFRYRGLLRNLGSATKNFLLGKKEWLQQQWNALMLARDPFDTFDYLKALQERSGKRFIYFINMGVYSRFDKNLPARNKSFQQLLRQISTYADVGIHPSFYANEKPESFKTERSCLEKIIEKPVFQSRQHYLKLNLPETYRHLIDAGITEDYTMIHATRPGFRAGTCTPFPWFDLQADKATELTVYPTTYMEGTLGEYLNLDPMQAWTKIQQLKEMVANHNGCFISLWHNHTVNDLFFWKGWKQVFEQVVID